MKTFLLQKICPQIILAITQKLSWIKNGGNGIKESIVETCSITCWSQNPSWRLRKGNIEPDSCRSAWIDGNFSRIIHLKKYSFNSFWFINWSYIPLKIKPCYLSSHSSILVELSKERERERNHPPLPFISSLLSNLSFSANFLIPFYCDNMSVIWVGTNGDSFSSLTVFVF